VIVEGEVAPDELEVEQVRGGHRVAEFLAHVATHLDLL